MTVDEGIDISPLQDRGVLKRIVKEGVGEETPTAGCNVSVHYVGTLLDGSKFDSSRDRNEPFSFDLGKGSVIKAWDIGIATMKKGEICVLTCAPEYAYGATGSPPKIPPNSTLQFEVEMLDWEVEDLSPTKNKGIVRYRITPGTGSTFDRPNDGALVTVELEGRLQGSSEVFDTRTVTFNLGEGVEHNICDGIERALEKFQRGEKSKLVIQPKYAFRSEGNAELKVPPNAVVEYIVVLKEFEKAKEAWSMTTLEKIEQAKLFKEKGTNNFKNGKYPTAIKMYKKVLKLVEETADDASESPENRDAAREITLSTHLNLSLVYMKYTPPQNFEAKEHATKALKYDPNNVKGLFRRGQALLGLSEAALAIADFEKVIQLEPTNKAAMNQITICKSTIVQQKEKEKRLYANMFQKFAEKDRERARLLAQDQPDVMSQKLGEWGDSEWGDEHRMRAPTHFEKENPNILMLDKDGQFENM